MLEKRDRELAEEERKEQETKESPGNSDEQSNLSEEDDSENELPEENEDEDKDDSEEDEDSEDKDESEEDEESEDKDESEEDEDSEDESEEDEKTEDDKDSDTDDEKESNDPKDNEDKAPEDSNKVNSEDRKKLGPKRQGEDDGAGGDKPDSKKGSSGDGEGGGKGEGGKGDGAVDKAKNAAANKISEKLGDKDGNIAKVQAAAEKATAAAKGLASGVAFLAKTLVNPIFWGVVIALIIVASLASTVSVIGGNDYNKMCDASGVGSVSIATDADDFTRQSAIASWLMNTPFEVTGGQPMNKEQASGVLGNLILESYNANPKAMTGDVGMTAWQSCDNDCVLSWGGRGKAIGLIQWMGGRREALARFAKSEGTQWHDLTTQLKFLKVELDSGEGANLRKAGFGDAGKTVEDYTWIWQDKFERAGESRTSSVFKMREQYALDFDAKFNGASSGGGSLATQCVGGGGAVDASNLVQLALQISYTREEKAAGKGYGSCPTLINCGDSFSKPEFITAKKMAEDETGADPQNGLTASCDRLVATLYRLTGVDTNFPWGGSAAQISYMDSSPNWKSVSCQERQPGDAIARPGHIMAYIGMVDGRETISSASIALQSRVGNGKGRAAHLSDLVCKGDSWFADGANSRGWRRVE